MITTVKVPNDQGGTDSVMLYLGRNIQKMEIATIVFVALGILGMLGLIYSAIAYAKPIARGILTLDQVEMIMTVTIDIVVFSAVMSVIFYLFLPPKPALDLYADQSHNGISGASAIFDPANQAQEIEI